MANKVKVKTPHGIVVIYNYKEKFGDKYVTNDPFEIEQTILNSASLISVQTQKNKNNPAGSFEIKLAPYKNWVSAITPGSWCVILMSNSPLSDAAKYGGGKVSERSFKMLGRIESVRGVVNTNATTGAISKHYIVTGSDWGTVFNSTLYIDPVEREPNSTAMGMALRFGYFDYLNQVTNWTKSITKDSAPQQPNVKNSDKSIVDGGGINTSANIKNANNVEKNKDVDDFIEEFNKSLEEKKKEAEKKSAGLQGKEFETKAKGSKFDANAPTASRNIRMIVDLWGNVGSDNEKKSTAFLRTNEVTEGRLLGDAAQQFKIPETLRQYMGFSDVVLSSIIDHTSGTGALKGYDSYEGYDPSIGIVNFENLFGQNVLWSVLLNNMNKVTSELIPEVRFTNGVPSLTLYNRIKPFVVNKENLKKDAFKIEDGGSTARVSKILDNVISEFKNVRAVTIDYRDVILSSFGTNWRDKVNFVEVNLDRSLLSTDTFSALVKLDSQFYDKNSISRDGLHALKIGTQYVPINEKDLADPLAAFAYKYLLKEWYFNTHTMLNGTLTMVGQDKYIQVGDNIKVDARVLDINRNFNSDQLKSKAPVYLLAHVESISHNMEYHGDHRVFMTSINFVRGILVDENRDSINKENSGALDQDASKVSPGAEVNSRMSGSSSSVDPDRQRLGFIKEDENRVNSISKEDGPDEES